MAKVPNGVETLPKIIKFQWPEYGAHWRQRLPYVVGTRMSRRYQVSTSKARRWKRGGVGNWEGNPLPSQLEGMGSVVSSLSGVPKLNFAQSECKRSHLVERIALNFLP